MPRATEMVYTGFGARLQFWTPVFDSRRGRHFTIVPKRGGTCSLKSETNVTMIKEWKDEEC